MNFYLVGDGDTLAIIDPGPDDVGHIERLWRAALRVDARRAADQLAVELRDLLERWTRRERE